MRGKDVVSFYQHLHRLPVEERMFRLISVHCAPTVAGLKISTMVNLSHFGAKTCELWEGTAREAAKRLGLDDYVLHTSSRSHLVLFYRAHELRAHLEELPNKEFLISHGYREDGSLEENLARLRSRFSEGCPHEIGIFLGYPLADVKAFCCKDKRQCLATGYWKCYENVEESLRLFRAYDRCRLERMRTFLAH